MITNFSPQVKPTPEASGIQVMCAFTRLADVADLKPNPRNPNKHPDKQIALLAKVIRHQGWRSPIVVSERSGLVVKGHGRLEAARLLGVQQVPVDDQHYASEEDELADLIADNKIGELAELDQKGISELLKELDRGGLDMELTGFDVGEIEDLIGVCNESESEGMGNDITDDVPCEKEAYIVPLCVIAIAACRVVAPGLQPSES